MLGFEADGVTLMRLEAAKIADGSRLNGEIKRRTDDGLPASFREYL